MVNHDHPIAGVKKVTGQVTTVTFGVKRDTETAKEQLKLLIERVVDEEYDGRYVQMFLDIEDARFNGFTGNLRTWLQFKLRALVVSK